jgi:predicted phosphodiesterase
MRAVVISDVHGNLVALDAVLADVPTVGHGVDAHWVLGDLVAHGPRPVECVRRMAALPGLVAVRGNTDRYVLTEPPSVEMGPSLDWTRRQLGDAGLLDWLGSLPVETRPAAPDGSRVLLVHASPGLDDGPGLDPYASDLDLVATGFSSVAADLIVVGHTHHADERRVGGAHVVNPGPVSLPRESDDLARYAVLTSTDDGWSVEHHVVHYDRDATLADLDAVGHPSADWLRDKLTTPWG